MQSKAIKKTTGGSVQYDGAGVKLVRVIGNQDVYDFDPFLMLDAFDSTDPKDYLQGFPWHPHRGIETVTYLISGEIAHGDSLGNEGTIDDGCCQWMTAGSGIIHQEMPKEAKRMLGCQLWINLPQVDKMTEPVYRDIRTEHIPTVKEKGTSVRVISGTYAGTNGPEQGDFVKTIFLDVKLSPNTKWSFGVDPRKTSFCYMVEGSALVSESKQQIESGVGVLFGEGDMIDITATEEGIRFFLYVTKPLGESIAWRGPIVMNTQDELKLASKELREGTFIKHKV